MADLKLKADTAVQTVIDDGASLATTVRAAGDYDNGTNLDPFCNIYLTVQFDTTAPSALDVIAEVYILPGDGAGTEVFPEGGDAGLGSNFDPQAAYLVGVITTVNPSTSVDEVVGIPNVALYPDGNRFVLKHVSGQTYDLTWQLDIKPFKPQNV